LAEMSEEPEWIKPPPRVMWVCGRDYVGVRGAYRIGVYWGLRPDPQPGEPIYDHAFVFHWSWVSWLERS
jgi:hypothetical protein